MAEQATLWPSAETPVHGWAETSRDDRYRYELGRRWQPLEPLVLFVGLNPSTAGAHPSSDDLTCKKWQGFARRWGFGGFVAGNVFALRATDPLELVRRVRLGLRLEVVGERNDWHLRRLIEHESVGLIVPCWGSSVPTELRYRVEAVLGLIDTFKHDRTPVKCLGRTLNGDPRHPARLPYEAPLEPFDLEGAHG